MRARLHMFDRSIRSIIWLLVKAILVTTLCTGLYVSIPAIGESGCAAAGCPVAAVTGRQPFPAELHTFFLKAGTNQLGSAGPALPSITAGYPPTQTKTLQPYAPCILLQAIGYTESSWLQFRAASGQTGSTVISPDCGYGIMQVTSGMNGSDPGFVPARVAAEPAYNIGTGARILIQKWNANYSYWHVYIGDQNPAIVENWYYAVWAYNSFSWRNNPNNPVYDPNRPPFDGSQNRLNYPYQELIWGYAAHPPGPDFWQPLALTLPDRSRLPQTSTDPFPTHIDTPLPAHTSCVTDFLPLAIDTMIAGW